MAPVTTGTLRPKWRIWSLHGALFSHKRTSSKKLPSQRTSPPQGAKTSENSKSWRRFLSSKKTRANSIRPVNYVTKSPPEKTPLGQRYRDIELIVNLNVVTLAYVISVTLMYNVVAIVLIHRIVSCFKQTNK